MKGIRRLNYLEEDDEDYGTEDEDGELITPKIEKTFLELLPKLANRSKELKKKKEDIFPDFEELQEEVKKKKIVKINQKKNQ